MKDFLTIQTFIIIPNLLNIVKISVLLLIFLWLSYFNKISIRIDFASSIFKKLIDYLYMYAVI